MKLIPPRRQFLLVVLLPPITFGIHAAGALPGYSTVAATLDTSVTLPGTLGSIAVSLLLL